MDLEIFDIEKYKNLCNDIFENKQMKDAFEKCLSNLIIEKNKILSNENEDENQNNKIIMEYTNKIIENIKSNLIISKK